MCRRGRRSPMPGFPPPGEDTSDPPRRARGVSAAMMVSVSVVVVGGAGFIGSHLVDRLLADGQAVDVVDDLSTGSLANLSAARSVGGELKIHHLDAGSRETGSLLAMRRPDVLYHLATVTSGSVLGRLSRGCVRTNARPPRGRPSARDPEGGRRRPGDGDLRPSGGARPADQGARARTAWCAGRRGARRSSIC